MGYLTDAAAAVESFGGSIRDGISSIFSGDSANNVNDGPMSNSPRPMARGQAASSGGLQSVADSYQRSGDLSDRRNTAAPAVAEVVEPQFSSDMAKEASMGSFVTPRNPNFNPADPKSQMYVSNPSYEDLLAPRLASREKESGEATPTAMAGGGQVEPAADGDQVVQGAVAAISGRLSGDQAAVALASFVEMYGEEQLQVLVKAAMKDKGAAGSTGEVKGPGTGKSDDVKAAAGDQPYALSNGEYILPIEVVEQVGGGDHAKGIVTLDEIRERALASRPKSQSMNPSAA